MEKTMVTICCSMLDTIFLFCRLILCGSAVCRLTGGVPYPLTVPKLPTRDSLTDEQVNAMMEKGYNQAKSGEGLPVDEAFSKIREGI